MDRGRVGVEHRRGASGAFAPVAGTAAQHWVTEGIAGADRPIGSIYGILAAASARYGLDDVAVVLDAPRLGRQVFVGSRRPYGGELNDAPPGLYTRSRAIDADGVDLVVAACTAAVSHLVPEDRPRPADLVAWLTPIVERSRRNQWPFTLAVMRADSGATDELARHLRVTLRISDELAVGDGGLVAIALAGVRADDTVTVLHRVARTVPDGSAACPRFAFGVVACPSEADTATEALAVASGRLHDAIELEDLPVGTPPPGGVGASESLPTTARA